ncbi:MAG: hypothetical protein J6B98_01085 [Bacilli bacterium]|nr:hypothetical protein [Bacilli bacterium]
MLILYSFMESLNSFLLTLDGWVYSFINTLYKVFLVLSRISLFGEDDIAPFIRRVYMIIGVVMLFLLSYSLLTNIVNPEGKGKDSAGKTIFNVVKAVILLALVPTIFDFAYQIQDAILSHNTIGKIILGTGEKYTGTAANGDPKTPESILNDGGINMAMGVLQAFIVPTENKSAENTQIEGAGYTLEDVWTRIKRDGSFSYLSSIAPATAVDEDKRELEYHFLLSTVAACLLIYLLISYCLSLGFRVIKLAFYELIAPLPIMASILPNQKGMLEKWIKATLSTFLEVFIRIAILYFAVYILDFLGGVLNGTGSEAGMFEKLGVDGLMKYTIYAIIIMGVVTFVKQAPNLISEITGISSEHTKFGIREQLKNGGFFTAGAMAGGLATSAVRRIVSAGQTGHKNRKKYMSDVKNKSLSKKDRAKAGLKMAGTVLSTIGGMTFGAATSGIRGGINSRNKDASSFKDIRESAHKGSATEGERLAKKYSYRAKHGGFVGSIGGRFVDAGRSIVDWTGFSSVDALIDENKLLGEIDSKRSAIKNKAESLIDKEASKANSSFTLGLPAQKIKWKNESGLEVEQDLNFDASTLRTLKLNLEQAQASGKGLIEAQNKYDAFRSAFADATQNVALLDEKSWNKVSGDIRGDLAEVKMAANEYRTEIKANLSNSFVLEAGFNVDNVDQSLFVNDKTKPLKKLANETNTRVMENNAKISEYNKKRSEDDKK